VTANLDLVRSIYADFERGDFGHADRTHPEIEYVNVGGPTPGSRKGLTGMAEGSRDFLSAWEDYRAEPEEFREIDGERILVLLHHRGGKTSGLELGQMQTNTAVVFHVRDGKVTRLINYWDRDRALADLGLAPKDGSQQ
jgi:ketosteroid isomerase-like protein